MNAQEQIAARPTTLILPPDSEEKLRDMGILWPDEKLHDLTVEELFRRMEEPKIIDRRTARKD